MKSLEKLVEKTKNYCLVCLPGGKVELVKLPPLTAKQEAAWDEKGIAPTYRIREHRFKTLTVGFGSEELLFEFGYVGNRVDALGEAYFRCHDGYGDGGDLV